MTEEIDELLGAVRKLLPSEWTVFSRGGTDSVVAMRVFDDRSKATIFVVGVLAYGCIEVEDGKVVAETEGLTPVVIREMRMLTESAWPKGASSLGAEHCVTKRMGWDKE